MEASTTSDQATRAVQQLFQEHGPAVYRFALTLLHQHHDAEDVLQETFLKLLHHLQVGGGSSNLRGWIFTVAANAARDRQRRRERWLPWAAAQDPVVAPPSLADEDGRLRVVRLAACRLSPRDRLLLSLRAQGLSYREIASAAGVRASSVGRMLARAIDRWGRACGDSEPNRKGMDIHEVPQRRQHSGSRR